MNKLRTASNIAAIFGLLTMAFSIILAISVVKVVLDPGEEASAFGALFVIIVIIAVSWLLFSVGTIFLILGKLWRQNGAILFLTAIANLIYWLAFGVPLSIIGVRQFIETNEITLIGSVILLLSPLLLLTFLNVRGILNLGKRSGKQHQSAQN